MKQSRRSAKVILGDILRAGWQLATNPPDPYDLVALFLPDGSLGRGTWTGKMWWGRADKPEPSHVLEPLAWRPLE